MGPAGACDVLSVELEVDDRLLLYTDGLGEARYPTDGSFFPLRRTATPALSSGSLDEGLRGVQESVRDWTGGALTDDVALLAVEVLEVETKA